MARLAAYPEPMNVEQFLDFGATRPDDEKWELLDGELFLNASPAYPHQIVVDNIVAHLRLALRAAGATHRVSTGTGVRLSDITLVQPDVMIRPRDARSDNVFDDIVVAFEILSPSTRRHDLQFKRKAYAGLASLTHYVVAAPKKRDVRVYARAEDWREVRMSAPGGTVDLPTLRVNLPLAAIYDDMDDFLEPAPE